MKDLLRNASAILAAGIMSVSANATIISFDGASKNGGVAETGVASGLGVGMNGSEPYGQFLTFNDFQVTAGQSTNINLATAGSFNLSHNIDQNRRVYQDWRHAGLGAVTYDNLRGDGLESNVGHYKKDEVLFFDFGTQTLLETVFFNGGHRELTKTDGDTNYRDGKDALFNIFASDDGLTYSSILGGQKQPTNRDFLSTGLSDTYQYFAVAATGWGSHSSYVEAIEYTKVSEPGSLALLGLGLASLGLTRRKQKS